MWILRSLLRRANNSLKSGALLLFLATATSNASATIFVVTNTNDSGPGSLRQAITDANNNSGLDTINFNIPGSGVHTIAPSTALPAITEAVIIDGYTQPGATANTLADGDDAVLEIELAGNDPNLGVASALTISAGGCTVRGLVINRFGGNGIEIALGADGNLIEGNFIGTDVNGTASAGNLNSGILVLGDANTIGGTTPAVRNLISGNADTSMNFNGVRLEFANNNVVQGNIIGLDRSGVSAIPNQGNGISDISGASNTFGGAAAGAGNLISGNELNGIVVQDVAGATTGTGTLTLIAGNRIGTDVTGTLDRGNGFAGVLLVDVTKVTVGGTTAGAANLISGNEAQGVRLVDIANDNFIQGNFIGTDATGTLALGNTMDGVLIEVASQNNLIGGTAAGARNVISGNLAVGVHIQDATSTGNAVQRNSIFSNGSLGIDLNGDGVSLNDTGDADTGPNNLQNFPLITSVTNSSGSVHIVGTLDSLPSANYTLEFFGSDKVDPTHFGEGQVFLGSTDVSTNASGTASFDVTFPTTAGPAVTATATDATGNTSEFSLALIPKLLNISTRLQVLIDDNVLIGGFIITGTVPKNVIVRGIGPSLSNFGVTGALMDTTLELHEPSGTVLTNDDWKDSQQAEIEATGIPPSDDRESAIVQTLDPGAYTAIVRGKNNTTGIGLVETYDLDQPVDSELANISTRGFVDTGDNVMIGGFIIGPADVGNATVVVRAIGPSLGTFGVGDALQDPTLELHDANGLMIGFDDNWKDTQQAEIEAAQLAPSDDRESAIEVFPAPGAYTAIVRGKGDTTGVGLVEAYNLN